MTDMDHEQQHWHELTQQIQQAQDRIAELAAERQQLTQKLYSEPGVTHRSLAARLGVSSVLINKIRHRGEPKPGVRC